MNTSIHKIVLLWISKYMYSILFCYREVSFVPMQKKPFAWEEMISLKTGGIYNRSEHNSEISMAEQQYKTSCMGTNDIFFGGCDL